MMRNGDVQRQIIASITDSINNGLKGNTKTQTNPYSTNPLITT
jgi:hypothetical protein